MGKKTPKKSVQEYKLENLGKEVKVGDTVLLKPPSDETPSYVARIEEIEIEKHDVKIKVRWYYRPEESMGGRRNFHGEKELFLSDHYDISSIEAVEGKCKVHTFKNYVKLPQVGAEDYFCRFEYKASTGAFKPDQVAVYCVCEMPYNPDDLMVQCENCQDWFHPQCINVSPDLVKKMTSFVCQKCKEEMKKNTNGGDVASTSGAQNNGDAEKPATQKQVDGHEVGGKRTLAKALTSSTLESATANVKGKHKKAKR